MLGPKIIHPQHLLDEIFNAFVAEKLLVSERFPTL